MRKLLLTILAVIIPLIVFGQDFPKLAEETNRKAEASFNSVHRHSDRDSVTICRAVMEGVRLSLKCDEYDRMPNRKGKIARRFYAENLSRVTELYPMLIDAGIFLAKKEYTKDEGLEALKMYLSLRNDSILNDIADESGIAAYYLAYYYLKAHNLKTADEYADLAMKYDETALEAAEIKAQCMHAQMITAEDSLKYLAVLKRLYATNPTSEKYFSWIMRFYQRQTERFNLEDFVDGQLEQNPHSPVPWILKGEIAMHAKRWEEAVEAYKQADELDPSSIPVAYNIGVCLNMRALEVRDEVLKKKAKGEFVSNDEYLGIIAEARNYLERVRAKDPRRNRVDWIGPLYMDYVMLDDKIKANELEPLVNRYK